jgi:WD40 repeat protein
MGVVYGAWHLNLKRPVALKMLLAGGHADAENRDRFRAEAEIVARLQHPNIIEVHEIGEHEGLPYFALEYIDGGNLEQQLNGTPWPAAPAAQLIETVARATHYAHQRGVIHRDLKPANILLQRRSGLPAPQPEPEGTKSAAPAAFRLADYEPKISDFGLAKRVKGGQNQTRTGDVWGTPGYISPEQAAGETRYAGPPADVYSLGAILYELVTGRPPFKGATPMETVMQVLEREPAPPRQLNAAVPRDLETICLKCLRKEERKRYASALELAEDLSRFRGGDSIMARPAGRAERFGRWCRRNPWLAAVGGLAVAALLAMVALAVEFILYQSWANERTGRALREAEEQRDRADLQHRETERVWTGVFLEKGQGLCEQGDVARGMLWMARALEGAAEVGDADLERAARIHLAAWYRHLNPPRARLSHDGEVVAVAFRPDGQVMLTGSDDGTARLWAIAGEPLGLPLRHERAVRAVAFGPDGSRVLTACDDGAARIWDAATGKPVGLPLQHEDSVSVAVYSPDGRTILTASDDGTARLWDADHSKPLAKLEHADRIRVAAFSPNGLTIVTGSDDSTARLWQAATGKPIGTPLVHEGWVRAAAFSPDSRTLVTGSNDKKVRLWDATTGAKLREISHDNRITAVAFSSDGKTLVSSGEDMTLRVWETATGKPLYLPLQLENVCRAVAFNSAGDSFVTACDDGKVQFWDAATGKPVGRALRHGSRTRALALSPDGHTLLTGSQDRKAYLWEVGSSQPDALVLPHDDWVQAVAFSPDGKLLLTACKDRKARLWDAATGKLHGVVAQHGPHLMAAAFSPDGRLIATAAKDGSVRLWDVVDLVEGKATTSQKVREFVGHEEAVWAVAFSPDGQTLATASRDHSARLWQVSTGKPLWELRHKDWVSAVAFSPNGQLLLTGSDDGTVCTWNVASGQRVGQPLVLDQEVRALAWSPDGQTFLTGGFGRIAQFWDVATRLPRDQHLPHQQQITAVAFSPDGRTVVTGSWDQTARLWDAATGQPIGPPLLHRDRIDRVAFSPDGRAVLTACRDRTAILWKVPVPVEGSDERILLWVQVRTHMELGPDGLIRSLKDSEWQDRAHRLEAPAGEPVSIP